MDTISPIAGQPTETTAVDKEANKKPLRHVSGSRWLVHHLFRYHYLPYWPRNVDRVFATVDIRTGKAIAACVFAFPVLRCNLREQVFGKLTPEQLNTSFRQLVRLMVDPEYRSGGVAVDLLTYALTQMKAPVVEAINRVWVPEAPFHKCGFIERSDKTRHYYYRLKDCRQRVDEFANPPRQEPPKQGALITSYPRIWHIQGNGKEYSQTYFQQQYEGGLMIRHQVGEDYVTRTRSAESATTLNREGVREVTDVDEKERLYDVLYGTPQPTPPKPKLIFHPGNN